MRDRVIEERRAHSVSHGKLSRLFHEKTAVLESAHCVDPCFAARIDETTIDPARHFIYLQPHVYKTYFSRFYLRVS